MPKRLKKPVPTPEPQEPFPSTLSAYMAAIGSKGGKVSGAKRMKMPAKKRREIALKSRAGAVGQRQTNALQTSWSAELVGLAKA